MCSGPAVTGYSIKRQKKDRLHSFCPSLSSTFLSFSDFISFPLSCTCQRSTSHFTLNSMMYIKSSGGYIQYPEPKLSLNIQLVWRSYYQYSQNQSEQSSSATTQESNTVKKETFTADHIQMCQWPCSWERSSL